MHGAYSPPSNINVVTLAVVDAGANINFYIFTNRVIRDGTKKWEKNSHNKAVTTFN